MRKSVIVYVLVVIAILAGCGQAAVNVSKLSPEQLVNTYYQSLGKGDYSIAKSCLDAELLAQSEQDPDSDYSSIKRITSINVSPGIPQQPYNNYQEIKIVVQYNAEYKDEYRNGMQTRSVIVAKKTSNAPWRIVSIGSY